MILLTGATGFLGMELVKRFPKRSLRCLVRSHSYDYFLKDHGCSIVAGDVADKASLERASGGIGVVVHAAAVISAKSSSDYDKVNVEGTRNVVEAARKAGVRHFILISSILAAYPEMTAYGRSKLASEEIVRNSGLPYTILRLSLVYGDDDTKTMGSLARFIRKSPVIPLVGSGRGVVQPVYAGDVASAVVLASSAKPGGMTYYLAGPEITFRDAVSRIASQLHVRRLLLPVPMFIAKPLVAVYGFLSRKPFFRASQVDFIASDARFSYADAERDLNFRPIPFSEGVKLLFRKL